MWGYDESFLDACRDELTISQYEVVSGGVQVAELAGKLAGVAQITVNGEVATLDKLFVDADHLRSGVGEKLYWWAIGAARQIGASTMVIEADPGAASFYQRMGAAEDGAVASGAVPGRLIPRLRVDLR